MKNMFKKNKKSTENVKEKKVRTVKVGTHKKTVIALWVVLIASVSFGVYKNFTAIDQHTLLYRYGAERGINTFHVITERGCDDMKPSDFQKTIQCQFDCKLKRVVKGIVRNYRKELKRRRNKEISYCELPEIVVEKLAVWDEYESDYTAFDVCGIEVGKVVLPRPILTE